MNLTCIVCTRDDLKKRKNLKNAKRRLRLKKISPVYTLAAMISQTFDNNYCDIVHDLSTMEADVDKVEMGMRDYPNRIGDCLQDVWPLVRSCIGYRLMKASINIHEGLTVYDFIQVFYWMRDVQKLETQLRRLLWAVKHVAEGVGPCCVKTKEECEKIHDSIEKEFKTQITALLTYARKGMEE